MVTTITLILPQLQIIKQILPATLNVEVHTMRKLTI